MAAVPHRWPLKWSRRVAKSHERDYVTKRAEYLAYGLREYWIVDLPMKVVTVLIRDGDAWVEQVYRDDQHAVSLVLPGFAIRCRTFGPRGKTSNPQAKQRTESPEPPDQHQGKREAHQSKSEALNSARRPMWPGPRPAGRWPHPSGISSAIVSPSGPASPFCLIIEQTPQAGRDRFFAQWIEVPAGFSADFGQGGRIGQGDWQPLGHGFDGRDAEAFTQRRKHECGRLRINGTQGTSLAISRHPDHDARTGGCGRLAEEAGFVVGAGADQNDRQIAGRHFRQPCAPPG